ncbi:hypothetical protein TREMEDRAFT_33090 [Tremella mesenterica DSM 1558]|uniref:uncharacterized protein n=1 Tax=Tremella mesenterica (strain ATCC 24925 / CBS 8224 / DSM 1558 / NBRC 9311 / NRRL Y-6157 / RJB 2259-6 / UBC 559-6) TaxID=578456 RepID=UPI0003F49F6F|nr:uncharacterized protein TREMEDRAFT_33090 [Tremella mesenterica DSM 1558]EIW67960.1 hypothetical protein TREMEDRAFT_33090 [Tremella mesenterica DSM 1558]
MGQNIPSPTPSSLSPNPTLPLPTQDQTPPLPTPLNPSDKPGTLTILTASDVDTIISSLDPETILQSQSEIFISLSTEDDNGKTQLPPRTSLKSNTNTTLYMPSRTEKGEEGIKIVSVPLNGEGLPASTILMDELGRVKGVINARKLTALRNAAGKCCSALFLRSFPPLQLPTNLVIFGLGAQSSAHANLFLELFPSLTTCTFIARRDSPRGEKLIISLQSSFPKKNISIHISTYEVKVTSGESQNQEEIRDPLLSQIIHNAQIICTLTPSTEPLFNSVDICSGTSVILVGSYKPFMREVDEGVIRRSGIVIVDSRSACKKEAGELVGLKDDKMMELGDVIVDGSKREKVVKEGDLRVYKSVGMGLQDVAIAELIFQQAQHMGLGTVIPNFDSIV